MAWHAGSYPEHLVQLDYQGILELFAALCFLATNTESPDQGSIATLLFASRWCGVPGMNPLHTARGSGHVSSCALPSVDTESDITATSSVPSEPSGVLLRHGSASFQLPRLLRRGSVTHRKDRAAAQAVSLRNRETLQVLRPHLTPT